MPWPVPNNSEMVVFLGRHVQHAYMREKQTPNELIWLAACKECGVYLLPTDPLSAVKNKMHRFMMNLGVQVVDTSEMWIGKLNELVERKVIPHPGAFKSSGK